MLSLKKKVLEGSKVCLNVDGYAVDESLKREWLLTNKRGGFACGSAAGINTRRYHGLLTGSLNPPVKRVVGLSNCAETIVHGGKSYQLGSFEFGDRIWPEGYKYIKEFRRDGGVHFDYSIGEAADAIEVTKSIYLLEESDTVAVVYDFSHVQGGIDFEVRPFAALRDFHSLQKSQAKMDLFELDGAVVVRHQDGGDIYNLSLRSDEMSFERDEQWWYDFVYRTDRRRGQDFAEDLWTPGVFRCRVDGPGKIVLWASVGAICDTKWMAGLEIGKVCEQLEKGRQGNKKAAKDERFGLLCEAADQFVVKRQVRGAESFAILAGFPWFADWGRDTFISLPGLLLCRGKFDQAKSILVTFADAVDLGMVPNRFDDYSNEAHYNSIDASLWFVNAAFLYAEASGDVETFEQKLVPVIRWIVEAYHGGTRYGISADADGLIRGGDRDTQLTWMDAKCDGVAFTPRDGKAVEINALWYNGLCRLRDFYMTRDIEVADKYRYMAEEVAESFCKVFWNEEKGYLNDCVGNDGVVDDSLRPNQIYAVSLEHSPLSVDQKRAVVRVVKRNLLTKVGLRSLSADDIGYRGRYEGGQFERDGAYHNGTVWAYPIGAFVEAYLRVHEFSRSSKKRAGGYIEPLLEHLVGEGCLGSISEIFDGDEPHEPRGCFAQAWSVAEVLRAYRLTKS